MHTHAHAWHASVGYIKVHWHHDNNLWEGLAFVLRWDITTKGCNEFDQQVEILLQLNLTPNWTSKVLGLDVWFTIHAHPQVQAPHAR